MLQDIDKQLTEGKVGRGKSESFKLNYDVRGRFVSIFFHIIWHTGELELDLDS